MALSIFWPVIVLVGLTCCVWAAMYFRRISDLRNAGVHPQLLATRDMVGKKLPGNTAADNFSNLLEVPVLFYLICIVLFVTDQVTGFQLFLAWLFVALRLLHSIIHVTFNRVVYRWVIYVISTLCLIVMWGGFAVALWVQTTV